MDRQLIDAIRGSAHVLGGGKRDYDPLLRMAADARLVLLGEPTHGSQDVHRERARITQRLISELGFTGVVWEADWPDAERAGRWARAEADGDAAAALGGFERFPSWMWRNAAVVDFLRWLRRWNQSLPAGAPRTGVYGMDLYSLYRSVQAVIRYLDEVDPAATTPSRRSRTRGWRATRSSTTARSSARASPPGTCAIATWPRRSRLCSSTSPGATATPAWWSGRTTRTSAMHARRRWARKAS